MPRLSQEPALTEVQPLVSEGEPELTAQVRDATPAAATAMRALHAHAHAHAHVHAHVLSSTTSRQLVSGIIMCAASKWCGPLLRLPDGFLSSRSTCSLPQHLFLRPGTFSFLPPLFFLFHSLRAESVFKGSEYDEDTTVGLGSFSRPLSLRHARRQLGRGRTCILVLGPELPGLRKHGVLDLHNQRADVVALRTGARHAQRTARQTGTAGGAPSPCCASRARHRRAGRFPTSSSGK